MAYYSNFNRYERGNPTSHKYSVVSNARINGTVPDTFQFQGFEDSFSKSYDQAGDGYYGYRETRAEERERREKNFVPSFILLDACKINDERKVKEICRKLTTLGVEDMQPVINFQDHTGRVRSNLFDSFNI